MVHTFYSHGARGRWRTGTGPRGGGCAMPSEADTCRQYVVPKLYAAGWTDDQIAEQRTFTAEGTHGGRRGAGGGQTTTGPYALFFPARHLLQGLGEQQCQPPPPPVK